MFLEILVDKLDWHADDEFLDLLELPAQINIIINDKGLPVEYFPEYMTVKLYETAYELVDLLGHLIANKENTGSVSAEFCYTGNFLEVDGSDFPNLKASIRYNPMTVDNEELLKGDSEEAHESITFEELAKEIMIFAIATYELILNHNSDFEDELEGLQATLLQHQETLENEYKVELFPPEEN